LATAACHCILGRFQLHDYTRKTLRQRIVNVARHSVSFFENSCLAALLGKFIELNRQHGLVCERLRQFDLLRSIRGSLAVTNTDEPCHASAHKVGILRNFLVPSAFKFFARSFEVKGTLFNFSPTTGSPEKKSTTTPRDF